MTGQKAPRSDIAAISDTSALSDISDTFVSPALEVLVNGEPQRVPPGCCLEQLLRLLGMSDRRVAVAVNGSVVARSQYASAKLSNQDRVEILEAVGGG